MPKLALGQIWKFRIKPAFAEEYCYKVVQDMQLNRWKMMGITTTDGFIVEDKDIQSDLYCIHE